MDTYLTLGFVLMLSVWAPCFCYVYFVRRIPLYHPCIVFLIYFLGGYIYRCAAIGVQGGSDVWDIAAVSVEPQDILFAAIVSIVGLLSYVFIPIFFVKDCMKPARLPNSIFTVKRPVILVGILLAMGGLAFQALNTAFKVGLNDLDELNAVEVFIDASGGNQLVGVSGYETAAAGLLPAVLVIFFYSRRSTFLMAIGFGAYLIFCLWVGTSRISFVSAAIGFLIAIMARLQTGTLRLKHLLIVGLVLGLFDLIGANRVAIKQWLGEEVTFTQMLSTYSDLRGGKLPLSDMHEIDSTTMVVHLVPQETGYNYGTPYLRLFIWPIPRQWWPDKPILTDRIEWLKYGHFVGQTKSLIGMAYADLGFPSLILILGLVGVFLNKLYRWAWTSESPYALAIYSITIMFAPIIFRDGGVSFVYFIGIPIVGVSFAIWAGGISSAPVDRSAAHLTSQI